MAKTVIVGCKLPHGIILEDSLNPLKKVEIRGLNKSVILGAEYATTEVDSDFFDQWMTVNKEMRVVKSGAIFVAKSAADLNAIAAEFKDRKTGFEPMRQDALGVKPATAEA